MSKTVEPFADVDVAALADWLLTIPVAEWPGMADPAWHGWSDRFASLAKIVLDEFPDCSLSGVGLFLLLPGQEHPTHKDVQPPDWVTRVHIPIVTNALATVATDDGIFHMSVGKAYRFNTRENHAVRNGGETPRVHFICDLRSL